MMNHKQQAISGKDLGFEGLKYFPEFLDRPAQEGLVAEIRRLLVRAPLFQPVMPGTGQAFSVRMSNLGSLGWVSDQQGYLYQEEHPLNRQKWPPIPLSLLDIWQEVSGFPAPPEACLVNYYEASAKMGLHQDKSEENLAAPVVSISLGDTALFRLGGLTRQGSTASFKLASGDVLVLGGASRLRFHGIDRIYPGTSTLLRKPGRINLTLRRISA